MGNIRVISNDLDGADLRREKRLNSRHIRCDGHADEQDINDALASAGNPKQFGIPGHLWERIFGRR